MSKTLTKSKSNSYDLFLIHELNVFVKPTFWKLSKSDQRRQTRTLRADEHGLLPTSGDGDHQETRLATSTRLLGSKRHHLLADAWRNSGKGRRSGWTQNHRNKRYFNLNYFLLWKCLKNRKKFKQFSGESVVATQHDKIVRLLVTSVGEIHMKTMPAAMFRLLTGQDQPLYL